MTSSLAARDVSSPQEKRHGMVEVQQSPATAPWQKGRASGADGCVQVAHIQEYVWVRDSKNPLGPALGFTRDEWAVFIVGVQCDEFDRPGVPA